VKRVLITGASGLIGRVLAERLSDRYDLVLQSRRPIPENGLTGDISSIETVRSMFADVAPYAVVHLAAAASVESPWPEVLNSNIIGTYNVFEAARSAGVELVVFASSNHVIGGYELDGSPSLYRIDDPRRYDEHTELRPDSLYGASKVFGEALGRYYSDRHGLRVVCLRIGSVLKDDDPAIAARSGSAAWLGLPSDELLLRYQATWLSQRDCAELFTCALESHISWAIAYGTSDNRRKIWDLTSASELLGYRPVDGA
jgi:NAD+ dependent glucose-6-phosphate dehydrogenase